MALGIPPQFLIAMFPSVNGYFFIPTYGSLIAAINFDLSGTTKIGKYVLNHSFMIPGLVATVRRGVHRPAAREADVLGGRVRMTAVMVKRMGLFGGPLLGLLCYHLLPTHYSTGPDEWVEFTPAGRATLALMVWMAGWWLTEAVDIEVTALLPIATFPLLGIAPLSKVLAPYAADVIFLFMGGFIIGLAIERWGLDRRIAFFTLRLVGARPGAIVGGFMAVTAFLSMWVSNTACAAMMVPIALSVIDLVLADPHRRRPEGVRRDSPGARSRAQLRHRPAALHRLRGIDRRDRHHHRLAPQRHRRALHPADLRQGRELLRLAAGGRTVHAPLPADRLAAGYPRPVSRRPRRDRGRPPVLRRGVSQARPLHPGREGRAGGVLPPPPFSGSAVPLLKGLVVAGSRPLAGLSDTGIAMLAAMALFL